MEFRPHNPFQDVMAVRDAQMLIGRSTLFRNLYSAIVAKQSISLVGSLHIGKSTMLFGLGFPEIQQRYQYYDMSRRILVFLDVRAHRHQTSEGFFRSVSQQIREQCQGIVPLRNSPPMKMGNDEFSAILDQIEAQGFHPILLMDAFDTVVRNQQFGEDFLSFLRSQALKVSYVTASIAPLEKICHQGVTSSPFFNIFGKHYVEAFTWDEARTLITMPAERVGLPFTPHEVAWILRQAGRHPFFIQRVCHHLFEEKLQAGNAVNLSRVKARSDDDLAPHYEKIWEHLTESEQEQLQYKVLYSTEQEPQQEEDADDDTANDNLNIVQALSESQLFRQFVSNKYRQQTFSLQVKDLESILEHLEDANFLGKCILCHFNIVSQRCKNDNAASVVARGVVVRKVLNEALEGMRGSSIRNDTALEWKYYNIIHYCYFKGNLSNVQIAARLSISERQYYREKLKAIGALLQVLLEMEVITH